MTIRTTALLPLRSPGVGKTRLAGALSVEQRSGLAGAMLADVASALGGSKVDEVVVVAGGGAAAAAASALGLDVLVDPPGVSDLDGALRAAATRLGPVPGLLVVAADLPRLTVGDVDAVLATDADVVVAPTTDGGTGGLLRRPSDACASAYGPGSAVRHHRLAERVGLEVRAVSVAGFRDDVDTVADLAALRDAPALGTRTAAWLGSLPPAVLPAG